MSQQNSQPSWNTALRDIFHPQVRTILLFGISAGLPLLLIFSSLSLWLREAGAERAAVTYFSWAALGYSFKFVWAPLVDKLPIPILTSWLGQRRSWLLLSQIMIIIAITMMAFINPAEQGLTLMAWAAVLLGFSSATQDVALDAYRIESTDKDLQTLAASSYIAGYRIGMLIAGAGALYLASYFGSTLESYSYQAWKWSYLIMAAMMLLGVITTLRVVEPIKNRPSMLHGTADYFGFLLLFVLAVVGFILSFYYSADLANSLKSSLSTLFSNKNLASFIVELCRLLMALTVAIIIAKALLTSSLVKQTMIEESYIAPIKDFFQRYGWSLAWLLLALIGLYRISDIVLGVISNVFYQDLGFTKNEIASVVKTLGLVMTIAGGFLGGILAVRFGVMRILFLGALLSALTNLLFMILAQAGHDMTLLYIVISADNLSAGLASAAFIAFLSSLTNVSFTAVQYAIFSSLMTLLPKILGGYSGTMVDTVGYQQFFLFTALLGIPVLILIVWANKYFDLAKLKVEIK